MNDTLLAVPFDLGRLEVNSAPVSVVGGIERLITGAVFVISDLGSLVYEPPRGGSRLVWVDQAGRPTALSAEPALYAYPRLSPGVDGERLAVSLVEGWQTDVWLYDLSHGTRDRMSYESGIYPVWTPDGSGVTYASSRSGTWNLVSITLDGTSQEVELVPPDADREEQLPTSWSSDGTVLLFARTDLSRGNRSYDVFTLSREGEVAPFLQTPFRETAARFSPDGAWVAYISDSSGRDEVYVQAFPNGERRPVSTDGGTEPVWSRDGRELFYRRGDDMMVVAFRGEPLQIGAPRRLFTRRYAVEPFNNIQNYDVAPDGQRFLMIEERSGDDASRRLVLVQNWYGELERLVPVRQ